MNQDLTDMLKRARLHHEKAVMAKPKSGEEMARMLNSLDNVILYLETAEQQSATAQMTVTQEPVTDAPPPCWHCHQQPRMTNQILCETCFGNAAEEMAGSGVLEKAMHSWIRPHKEP